jgi:hypothetical protein
MQEQLGHSAEVQMHLLLHGEAFAITHMGPDYVRLRESAEYPPATGQIVLVIDGHESRWQVHLPQGLFGEGRIPVERVA